MKQGRMKMKKTNLTAQKKMDLLIESLKLDLCASYAMSESFYERTSGDWICGIDTENLVTLKYLYKEATLKDGSISMKSFAFNLIKDCINKYKKEYGYTSQEFVIL